MSKQLYLLKVTQIRALAEELKVVSEHGIHMFVSIDDESEVEPEIHLRNLKFLGDTLVVYIDHSSPDSIRYCYKDGKNLLVECKSAREMHDSLAEYLLKTEFLQFPPRPTEH